MTAEIKQMIKVTDNFLDEKDFIVIQSVLMGDQFPWYYSNKVIENGGYGADDYQFTHLFFIDYNVSSSFYGDIISPIINKIQPSAIIRAKANLITRTDRNVEHGFHVDTENQSRTGILYVNDCDGYTLFQKTGEKVKSKQNRFVEFDSSLVHTGASPTDQHIRVAININYHEAIKGKEQ